MSSSSSSSILVVQVVRRGRPHQSGLARPRPRFAVRLRLKGVSSQHAGFVLSRSLALPSKTCIISFGPNSLSLLRDAFSRVRLFLFSLPSPPPFLLHLHPPRLRGTKAVERRLVLSSLVLRTSVTFPLASRLIYRHRSPSRRRHASPRPHLPRSSSGFFLFGLCPLHQISDYHLVSTPYSVQ